MQIEDHEENNVLLQETELLIPPTKPILEEETQIVSGEASEDLFTGETEDLLGEEDLQESETLESVAETEAGTLNSNKEKEEKLYRLPLGRIKNIMKYDPELNLASSESVFLITKATELFIKNLAEECHFYVKSTKKKTITKGDFDKALDNAASLAFLEGTFEE